MDASQLRRILLQQATIWHSAGVQVVARQEALELPPQSSPVPASPTPPIAGTDSMPPRKPPAPQQVVQAALRVSTEAWPAELARLDSPQRNEQLEQLRVVASQCTLCTELAKSRTQIVFGEGNPTARICFFGEAPGADEDRSGRAFVGRAGKLLTQIIEACGFQREDVYIFNTLKCRPPGNRNPTPEENANCRPYFERQLEIVQPEYIVCLGRYAVVNLLDTQAPVGKLRGQFHNYRGSKVLVTYHPAYLLRNPSAKKEVWEDMKMMLADMGLPIPTKKS